MDSHEIWYQGVPWVEKNNRKSVLRKKQFFSRWHSEQRVFLAYSPLDFLPPPISTEVSLPLLPSTSKFPGFFLKKEIE